MGLEENGVLETKSNGKEAEILYVSMVVLQESN